MLLPVSLTQTLTNRAGDGLLSGTGGSPVGLTGPWQPGATQAGVARLLPAVRGHAHRGLPCPGLSWPHPQQPEGALFVQPRCPAPVRTGALPHRRHPSRSPPRSEPLSPAQPSVRCGPARPPRALLRSVRGGHGNGQVWTRAGRPEAPSRPPPPASGRFRSSPGPAPLDGASGTAVVLFEVARFERLAGLSGHEENKEKIKTTKRLDNDQEQKGRAGRGRPEQTAAPWRPGRRQVGPCLGTRGAGTAGPPRGRRARGSAEGLGTFGVRREHRPRADDAHTVVYLCPGHRVCLRRVSPAPGAVNHGSTLWGPRSGCNPGTFDFSDLHAPHPTPRRGHHTLCGSAGEVAGTVGP